MNDRRLLRDIAYRPPNRLLNAVGVEQGREESEILVLAVVRRGHRQQRVPRDAAEQLAEAVSLGEAGLAAEDSGRHLVGILHDERLGAEAAGVVPLGEFKDCGTVRGGIEDAHEAAGQHAAYGGPAREVFEAGQGRRSGVRVGDAGYYAGRGGGSSSDRKGCGKIPRGEG